MKFERVWAMPNKETFTIKPIAKLLEEEVREGLWIDPFAGANSPADVTNDLNPAFATNYHMDAIDFMKLFSDKSVGGVLYDPPYSPRQVSECYHGFGIEVTQETTRDAHWTAFKKEIARIIRSGGKVISFGWNSGGVGKVLGFEIVRILLVPHGAHHNDTIVTVEIKL